MKKYIIFLILGLVITIGIMGCKPVYFENTLVDNSQDGYLHVCRLLQGVECILRSDDTDQLMLQSNLDRAKGNLHVI